MKPVEQEFRAASVCILIESCFKKAVCSIWSLICHHFIDIVIYIFSVVICNCCCLLKDWFNKGKMSSEDTLKSVIARSIKPVTFFQFSNVKRTRKERKKKDKGEKKRWEKLTLLEAEVGDFVNGWALTVHESEELIQEQLLFRVREPAALTADLHAAHYIFLKGEDTQRGRDPGGLTWNLRVMRLLCRQTINQMKLIMFVFPVLLSETCPCPFTTSNLNKKD